MRLNPKLPLSDPFMARLAAQAILRNSFDPKRTVAELQPGRKGYNVFFGQLMNEPMVRHELEKIMSRADRTAARFSELMWDWMEAPNATNPLDKSVTEKRLTAARILAKGYINEKKPVEGDSKPVLFEGLDGVSALTGEISQPAQKKVM